MTVAPLAFKARRRNSFAITLIDPEPKGRPMRYLASTSALLTLVAMPALADGHAKTASGYALSHGGTHLTVMADLSAPDATETLTLDTALDAIAYRPVTGELMGIAIASQTVCVIDLAHSTCAPTDAPFAAEAVIGSDATVGFDFNNAIDAVRAVSSDGVNLVYFPSNFDSENANSVRRFTDLAYADGDANAGATPYIVANAYTNAVNGAKQESTAQFAIDAEANALVTLANNAGTLETVAGLSYDGAPLDVTVASGFDILSAEAGDNRALALLTPAGDDTASLFEIDLETGVATRLATTALTDVSGFAVAYAN